MEKADYKIIKKSPEKIENKLKKEQEWISKQADAARKKDVEPDFFELFSKQLLKLKNPIQIWIRGTIFQNLGLDEVAILYMAKAEELGYIVEKIAIDEKQEWHNGKVHTYKSVNGHSVLEALDAETSNHLDQFFLNFQPNSSVIKESKEVFQMDPNCINGNIYRELEADIKKPEYDSTALYYLINDDPFLKIIFYQLSTGDMDKDLDLMFKNYVKGEEHLIKRMMQFESLIIKENANNVVKHEIGVQFNDLIKELGIKFDETKLQNSEIGNAIYGITIKTEDSLQAMDNSFDMLTSDARITIKNDLYGFKNLDLVHILLKSINTWQDNKDNILAKVQKLSNWNPTTCQWIVKCFEMAVKIIVPYIWIGGKECTDITAIATTILAKSVL